MTEKSVESLPEEPLLNRGEALALGHMHVVEAALAALILQAPRPHAIKEAMLAEVERLAAATPLEPDLAWEPPLIHSGALGTANRIIADLEASAPR